LEEEQEEIVAVLSRPSSYAHRPVHVRHLQTHISHVFVAPPYAYKLKRAIRLPFLDFSDRDRREWFCHEEVRVNRTLCPAIYLGVVPVTRSSGGVIAVGGDGEPLDHLVWMRSLPARGMLPVALAEGRIAPEHLEALAGRLAAFHAAAPTSPDVVVLGAPEAVAERWHDVLLSIASMVGELLPAVDHEILADFGSSFVRRQEALFRTRQASGYVRECHGDLHGGNLCLVETALPALPDAPPVDAGLHAFDCLEFSKELRAGDVASEVAFLVMDLEWRGRPDLARVFLSAYLARSEDRDLPLLLPYYSAYRALVRGMVDGLFSRNPDNDPKERDDAAERARRRFRLAARCAWRAAGPALIACRGLSGSGKTTIGLAVADRAGFELVSSDEIRKRRAGLDPRLPAPAEEVAALYSEAARRSTYEALDAAVDAALAAGRVVIADATFSRREERARIAEIARRRDRPFVILDCEAPPEVVRERLERRARQRRAEREPALSDAGWEVHVAQAAAAEPLTLEEPRIRVDNAGEPSQVVERALRDLWSWRRQHLDR
jgi:uncharacterized protein